MGKSGFCFGVDNLVLTDFSELYKLTIGYENDLSEQPDTDFPPCSALFWSHVLFAKQSALQNQQLERFRKQIRTLSSAKKAEIFLSSLFPFSVLVLKSNS